MSEEKKPREFWLHESEMATRPIWDGSTQWVRISDYQAKCDEVESLKDELAELKSKLEMYEAVGRLYYRLDQATQYVEPQMQEHINDTPKTHAEQIKRASNIIEQCPERIKKCGD